MLFLIFLAKELGSRYNYDELCRNSSEFFYNKKLLLLEFFLFEQKRGKELGLGFNYN